MDKKQVEDQISRLADRKKRVDQQIVEIEARIAQLEEDYLAETRPYGNIFRGLAGYLTTSAGRTVPDKTGGAREATGSLLDRPFSSISCTPVPTTGDGAHPPPASVSPKKARRHK